MSLQPNGISAHMYPDGQGLVTIRMKPDSQGRFGFKVKVRFTREFYEFFGFTNLYKNKMFLTIQLCLLYKLLNLYLFYFSRHVFFYQISYM